MFPFIRSDVMPAPFNIRREASELEIRNAGLDHWSDIRDLHALSFRYLTGPSVEPSQCAAFLARIREPDYTLALQAQDLLVAWIDRQPVGTAGWVPFDGRGSTARITSVCVSPLFTRLGVGRRLVEAAEERASLSGYRGLAARVFPPSVDFFESLGYARSSQGVQSLGTQSDLPVVFMRKGGLSREKPGFARESVAGGRAGPKR